MNYINPEVLDQKVENTKMKILNFEVKKNDQCRIKLQIGGIYKCDFPKTLKDIRKLEDQFKEENIQENILVPKGKNLYSKNAEKVYEDKVEFVNYFQVN